MWRNRREYSGFFVSGILVFFQCPTDFGTAESLPRQKTGGTAVLFFIQPVRRAELCEGGTFCKFILIAGILLLFQDGFHQFPVHAFLCQRIEDCLFPFFFTAARKLLLHVFAVVDIVKALHVRDSLFNGSLGIAVFS